MREQDKRILALLLFLLSLTAVSYLMLLAAPHDPLAINLDHQLQGPSRNFWFGTDDLGRDVFSRVLYGLNLTLKISLTALIISLVIGIVLGALAGFYQGRGVDSFITWLISVVFTLPGLLVLIAVLSVLEPGIEKAYMVLGFIAWVQTARIVRGEFIRIRNLGFVEAERALGASKGRLIFRTILPMSIQPALTASLYSLAELIALEAGLSFLGLGVQPPTPSIGKIVYDGLSYMFSAWWMPVFPGMALFVVVFLVNYTAQKLNR